ncbi:MAG: hypothetical protein KGY53_08950, partial [Wenzhouxiangellaceae bacterium]|nr:hypothetical protein [Wenzhouxiangellaceae bacterium]
MDRLKARIHGVGRRPVVLGILMDRQEPSAVGIGYRQVGEAGLNDVYPEAACRFSLRAVFLRARPMVGPAFYAAPG